MPTIIRDQPTSAEIRAELAAEGAPLLVAFSGGKDAIATELALRDSGIETKLAYLYYIPGREPGKTLQFVEDGLARCEDALGKEVHRYPHPSLYRWLNNLVFQPPERIETILAARLPDVQYAELWDLIRRDLDMPAGTLVADGVRAADSIVRRASFAKHGILKRHSGKVSPIADWLKAEVWGRIGSAGIAPPVDYEWFGRSFDGIDYRFLEPMSRYAPDDFARVLDWFPLAEVELIRKGIPAHG